MSQRIIPIWKNWMSLWAIKDFPKELSDAYTKELKQESADSLTMIFGDKAAQDEVGLRRRAKDFYSSSKSFGSFYSGLNVKDSLTEFDNLETNKKSGYALFSNADDRLSAASSDIFSKINSETDLSNFVKNEKVMSYYEKRKDNKMKDNNITWKDENGVEHTNEIVRDENGGIVWIKGKDGSVIGVNEGEKWSASDSGIESWKASTKENEG